ncbi:MAG: flagellar motor switch protein FliM [Hyphomicrobiales bacterium]|nr:flagellar motor switch protein FliM [Rickettsiales bacterium]MCP5361656.1 flagellar motor switch protein FliM [Hyphomicrobiales bacterium]
MADDVTSAEAAADEKAMARAMEEAMAAEGEGDASTLSQDEIDNLLGFDGGGDRPKSGIQALLDKSMQSYERLPMLEVVFDRFARTLSSSLRNFTNDNVDVSIDSLTSMRFEDYMNSIPLPALIVVFQAVEWENYGLVTIDSSLCYSMVDVLLGGSRSHHPMRIDGRPFTTIEQDIVRTMSQILLDDMSAAFNPLTPATFRLERLETNPRFATITRPSSAVILLSMRVDMEDRGGRMEILIPYATLEPIKDLLLQMFTGESFGNDSSWEEHLTQEIRNTKVELAVTLNPKKISLRELAALKVGGTILMDNGPHDELKMMCRGIPMLSGHMGRQGNNVALRVAEIFNKNLRDLL